MRTADMMAASDADWAEAHRREKIIRRLASLSRVPGEIAADAMEQLELGRARFHKLLQLYTGPRCCHALRCSSVPSWPPASVTKIAFWPAGRITSFSDMSMYR